MISVASSLISWGRTFLAQGIVALCVVAPLAAAATASSLPRVVLSVPGPHSLSYLPADLISKIGADREEGIEVQLLYTGSGSVALSNMTNRNADFAVAGLPAVLSLRANGGKAVGVAAVGDVPSSVLAVRSELKNQVRRFADLKGKVIGVSTSALSSKSTTQQLLEILLQSDGISPDMVRIVPAGLSWADQSALINSRMVHAIMGTEPFASRLRAENKVFFLAHLADPDIAVKVPGVGYLHATLATRPDLIDRDPQMVAKMVRIVHRTLQWIASHSPEEMVEKLEIPDSVERATLLECLKKYPQIFSKDGAFSSKQLQETEIFFRATAAHHFPTQSLTAESVVTDKWAGRRP